MGLVYLPTFLIRNIPNVGTYTSPMDPMGMLEYFIHSIHYVEWQAERYPVFLSHHPIEAKIIPAIKPIILGQPPTR